MSGGPGGWQQDGSSANEPQLRPYGANYDPSKSRFERHERHGNKEWHDRPIANMGRSKGGANRSFQNEGKSFGGRGER